MAEIHGGVMKIVAEREIRELEVEVLEKEKQPRHQHIACVYMQRERTGMHGAL